MKETDLYIPIKEHFIKNGYTVKAEVKHCDIACISNKTLTIIELKASFNLKLLYQALDRKALADFVFIGIPRPKNFKKKETRHMLKILKALNIGVITVAIDSPLKTVEIIYSPTPNKNVKKSKKKTRLINEFEKRNLDTNVGGSTSRGNILTAYREQSIYIACILSKQNVCTPHFIKSNFNIQNAQYILNLNHYNYFKKIKRGTYTLSDTGKDMLKNDIFKEAISYYKKEVDAIV